VDASAVLFKITREVNIAAQSTDGIMNEVREFEEERE
jgi:hypothetical protein